MKMYKLYFSLNLFLILIISIQNLNAQIRVPDDGASPIWYKDGKVGIGTNNPNAKLHLSDDALINGDLKTIGNIIIQKSSNVVDGDVRLFNHPGDTYGFMMRPYDSDFNGGTWNWEKDFGYRNDTKSWYVDSKFGVGTSDPGNFRIAVNGSTLLFNGNLYIQESSNVVDGDVRLFNHPGDTYGFMMRPYDSDFNGGTWNWDNDFGYRNDTKSWYVDTKFGIGTSNPNYKLDVNGTIRAKEIKVESSGADYVFRQGYNLRTLEEVETFIFQNKHLPEIPNEKEVKEKGISLGEMNTKLLQKIEELTLYVIEQNKELKKTYNDLKYIKYLLNKHQKEIYNLKDN